jgi:hypothetical protein
MIERAHIRSLRMTALHRLIELLRIAEQEERPGASQSGSVLSARFEDLDVLGCGRSCAWTALSTGAHGLLFHVNAYRECRNSVQRLARTMGR